MQRRALRARPQPLTQGIELKAEASLVNRADLEDQAERMGAAQSGCREHTPRAKRVCQISEPHGSGVVALKGAPGGGSNLAPFVEARNGLVETTGLEVAEINAV